MRTKLVAVLAAVLTAGAAFALSPVARADDIYLEDTNVYEGPQIVSADVADGNVYLEFTWSAPSEDENHPGGFNVFRDEVDDKGEKYFEFLDSIPAAATTYTDINPGAGQFDYALIRYLKPPNGDTWHTQKGNLFPVTVGDSPAPDVDPNIEADAGEPEAVEADAGPAAEEAEETPGQAATEPTKPATPSKPEVSLAGDPDDRYLLLSWENDPGVDGYRILIGYTFAMGEELNLNYYQTVDSDTSEFQLPEIVTIDGVEVNLLDGQMAVGYAIRSFVRADDGEALVSEKSEVTFAQLDVANDTLVVL